MISATCLHTETMVFLVFVFLVLFMMFLVVLLVVLLMMFLVLLMMLLEYRIHLFATMISCNLDGFATDTSC